MLWRSRLVWAVALSGAALGLGPATFEPTLEPFGNGGGLTFGIRPAFAKDTQEAGGAADAVRTPAKKTGESAGGIKSAAALAAKAKAGKPEPAEAGPDPADALLPEVRKGSVEAIQKLGALGTPRAFELLLSELSLGLSPKAASAALEIMVAKKVPDSLPLLTLYAHHRSPELRKKALSGLGAMTATPADLSATTPLLITALSDASADVRGVAAKALGDRKEKSAEPQLIKLLLRKDAAAPAALGKIGGPDTARALAEMIGNVPDSMITETLGELLLRPDFGPEPIRVEVVKTLGKMPGTQTLDILTDYMKETAKEVKRPSRGEAQKIIEQRTAK